MTERQTYSLDQIKDMLLGQLEDVVESYAPPSAGSYRAFGKYYTLNPGRADRKVGSFFVHMSGATPGRWYDFATREGGDILDLIALACHTDVSGAIREARAYLGLATMDPQERRRREERAAELKKQREAKAREERDLEEKRRRGAYSLWISAQAAIRATPVDTYLMGRGVNLAALGRQPGAIRFLPDTTYYHMDDETGEVFERQFPAMATIVTGKAGRALALHRTYLAPDPAKGWAKAPVPADWPFEPKAWKAKKVLGRFKGGWITLSNGIGPRGGKPRAVQHADRGQHVYVSEGIEDGLSVVQLLPEARVLAAVSLSNLADIDLPPSVSRVTLVADLDENEQAQDALTRAIEAHKRAGREVRLWQNRYGGKDLNDALREAREPSQRGQNHGDQGQKSATA